MGCAGSKDEVPKAPESATTKPDRTADATEAAVQTVTCYCGAVKITVTGEPQLTPMCHCSDCRSWTGDLGQAARLYTPDQVKIDGEIFGIEFDGKYALPRAALLPAHPPLTHPPQRRHGAPSNPSARLPNRNPSKRRSCKKCGGLVVNDHAHSMNMTCLGAGLFKTPFKPAMHLFYGERIMDIKDGAPKFKTMPTDFGGCGETMEE